jgi:hypothetical protein
MNDQDSRSNSHSENMDYHVRPWMLPYLPKDPAWFDFAVFFVGLIAVTAVSILLAYFEYEFIAVAMFAIGGGHFAGHWYGRMVDRWKAQK